MRLGMLHLFENPMGTTAHQIITEQMELMVAAEDMGFDSVWPAEHHFSEYGIMGSPQVSLAAIAARTKRIRLGTGVVVLPFHNPVRVAEDFAFLDHISEGRVDFGVGRGYQPTEYKGFGLEMEQSDSRVMFDEAIRLVRQCWTEERVTFKGKYYNVEDLMVRPQPYQQPHPPIYMACLSPGTFELAGRYGFNVLMSAAFGLTPERAKQGIANYRKAREEAGHDPAEGQIACLVMVYPGETMEQARSDFRDPVIWYYRTIAKYVAPPTGEVKTYEVYSKSRDFAQVVEFDDLVDGPVMVCGDTDHCTEKLIGMAREYGFNELLCWTRIGGLDNRKVLSAMAMLASDILPAVRKALPEAA